MPAEGKKKRAGGAEEHYRARQYEYKQNSNLVLEPERTARRSEEPTGEVESMVGKMTGIRMGDKVRIAQKSLDRRKRKGQMKRDAVQQEEDRLSKKKRRHQVFVAGSSATVLTETAEHDNLSYLPKTKETRSAYEELLSLVNRTLGDVPQDMLRGAADEILSDLKNIELKSTEKQSKIESLLATKFNNAEYSALVTIGKRITDFTPEDNEDEDDETEQKMDDALGVAVVFDEDEDEDDNDLDEVRDEEAQEEAALGVEAKSGVTLTGQAEEEEDDEENEMVLDPRDIDAHWLQRELSKFYDDANISQKLSVDVLTTLQSDQERSVENKLVVLLDYDKFKFIKLLLRNRTKIVYCTKLNQAQSKEDKEKIEAEMRDDVEGGGPAILEHLNAVDTATNWAATREASFVKRSRREARKLSKKGKAADGEEEMALATAAMVTSTSAAGADKILDLGHLSFQQGARFNSNRRCELPAKSWRAQKKGYEEVHVPPLKAPGMAKGEHLKHVDTMPKWAQKAFTCVKIKKLNRIQSQLYEKAFKSPDNLLLCAPTGAGKTNVAVMTILHEIGKHRKADGSIDTKNFKIVYVAPMKALVQETVMNFSNRLEAYGVTVKELSGDVQLTRAQIRETQVIVTTPEKWDIITRKSGDRTYTQLVRLLIIDEIHLLHDSRGAVLESIVARTIRQIETNREHIRIVGLSATLPNYKDVAQFCRVEESGLFYFDNSFRPVPLQQQYIGVTEKKAIKRFQLMNQITYEKTMDYVGEHQVLIFVHSRKETAKTARAIRDMAMDNDEGDKFILDDSAIREILQTESETANNPDLKELLPFGFGIHHAGLNRTDRSLVEDLFADGSIQVLVSTATLAWGVNLPAHTVIIKGTQIYSPEKGCWTELSYLDIMQMFGRAGRPQFDSRGEGIMITTHTELQYYLSLMNQQLPIESQFVAKLPDSLNAEVVMGTVQNMQEAVQWLSYTYLYVRMLRNPTLYGVSAEEFKNDPTLKQRRMDLLHTAASLLGKHGLVRYDRKSGAIQPTPLGRVASHYYITYQSVATFNDYLKPSMSEIELFRLFSLSYEFRNIIVRQEEKMELKKLLEQVPIPVKESIEEPSAKVNVLLQGYISQLKLEGFALLSDMVYVQQSAGRIMRALFEIALCRGWAGMADKTLNLCKMIDKRMWLSHTPLRQFRGIPSDILRKIERKSIGWERYYDLKPQDIGELIRFPKMGKTIYRFVHQFPRLELAAHVQPITRSMLKVELRITPDFQMDPKVHNWGEAFHVLVQDVDGEQLLHHEVFLLPCHLAEEEHTLLFTVPIYEPLPPQYFIKVVSDRWLHAESVLPVSFRHLILPEKYPPHTELLDLQPLPVTALRDAKYQTLYTGSVTHFNPIQTQVFNTLYESDDNVLVAAPASSGKLVAAEFAILRMFRQNPTGRCVFVTPKKELGALRYDDWKAKFGTLLKKTVVLLTGETTADLKLVAKGQIVIATPEQWDSLSRRWKSRPNVRNVALFIVDQLHLVGGQTGPVLEVVVSRMRYIAAQTENRLRIVALSASVANARDLSEWIGASSHGLFSFHPQVRVQPLEVHIQGFAANAFGSRMLAMSKPVYNSIMLHAAREPAIVFVPSRRQAQLTAIDMIAYATASGRAEQFLGSGTDVAAASLKLKNKALEHTLSGGVGFLHTGLSERERKVVKALFRSGALQVIVVQRELCWSVDVKAKLVTIMGTCAFDGREHRYVDYAITDMLQMMGYAGRPKDDSGCTVVLCHAPKKVYLKKFLHEPLPVESHLDHFLHDTLNAEIVTRTLENKQDAVDYMTWSLYYRRLTQNPNYYNLAGVEHQHVSDHLSELIESTLDELLESKCVSCEDELSLAPLNLGMIAAYYYIRYTTMEIYATSLQKRTKIRGLVKILAASSEFDDLPVRSTTDNRSLETLIRHLPAKVENTEGQARKANALLQAHFSRIPVSTDLRTDQRTIVGRCVQLLSAMVDVISSKGWLKPALAAMELTQMVVQARWAWDSPLLQVPYFTEEIVARCEEHNKKIKSEQKGGGDAMEESDEEGSGLVETVFDILDLEDDVREELLQLPAEKMSDVARFCNAYPNVDLEYDVLKPGEIQTDKVVEVVVKLKRDDEDEDEDADPASIGKVVAPSYPKSKTEGWWLVIGNTKDNTLLSIKRLTLREKARAKLEFAAPAEPGEYALTLYLMCDSYLRCDQEYNFDITVTQGESSSEEDESESDDGEGGDASE